MSENTAVLPEPQPGAGRRGARGLVAVGASALAVVLIAVGGFAAWQFFSEGGPQPAEVLPDSTFALVTVDLDPSGGQKIEAIQTLRKFPSWKKRIGVNADDDLMKEIVERGLEEQPVQVARLRAGRAAVDRQPCRFRRQCCSATTSRRPCSPCRSRTPRRPRPGSPS